MKPGAWGGGICLAAVGALIASPLAAADKPPIELKAAGAWQLDYGEEVCRLWRTFGQGDQQITIRLAEFGPGQSPDLSLIGEPTRGDASFANNPDPFVRVSVRLGEEGKLIQRWGHLGTLGKEPMVTFGRLGLGNAASSAGTKAAARSLDVRVSKSRPYRLLTGPMADPMKVMRNCVDNLLLKWKYDPDRMAALRSGPEPVGAGNWVQPSDYPSFQLVTGGMAITHFRLDVDAQGKVAGCHLQDGIANSSDFTRVTCKLISQRASFKPAIGADGQPIAAPFVSSIRWLVVR